MLRLAYQVIKDFGAFGLGIVNIGLLAWFFWKIMTNHFKHLQDDVSSIKKTQEKTTEKLDKVSERVSKIEGKLE